MRLVADPAREPEPVQSIGLSVRCDGLGDRTPSSSDAMRLSCPPVSPGQLG